MLQHYYGQCTIQPVNVVEESTISTSVTPSGPSTVTTPGMLHSHFPFPPFTEGVVQLLCP